MDHEVRRFFPEEESTTPKEVLWRPESRRRAQRKVATWMSHPPCPGLRQPPIICAESVSEDEGEVESIGPRAPGTETDVLSDTGPQALAVLRRIKRYKTWEAHRGSWGPLMTSRLLEHSASGTSDAREDCLRSAIDGSQQCPEMAMARAATKNRLDLIYRPG